MTEHLGDGSLQALLDGELGDVDERSTRVHLAACRVCRGRFEEVSEANHVLASALALLDPVVSEPGVIALPSPSMRARPSPWRRSAAVRAAAMLLMVAAAASATVPGSPVRRWLIETWAAPGPTTAPLAEPIETSAPTAAGAQAEETGVSVPLASERFEVVLSNVDPTLLVRARLVDAPRGAVYAIGAATDSRFATAPGLIEVSGTGAGELRVEIPRAAASASVIVDGRTYLVKDGDQLRLLPTDDAAPAEIIFRIRE